jgi:hypothetical protein
MEELQAKAQLALATTSWTARKLIAVDDSVMAVMVVGADGKILAHETAVGYDKGDRRDEDYPLLFFVPPQGHLFLLRLNKQPVGNEIANRVLSLIGDPQLSLGR